MKLTTFATLMGAGAAAGLFTATLWPTLFWPPLIAVAGGMILCAILMKIFPDSIDK